ncbi:MAG: hypothetical protein WCE94_03025 [Candidatus Methanoperedens sp.]
MTDEKPEEHLLKLPDERVKLLKAGFNGKEIEQLFLILNHYRTLGNVLYTCS